MQESKINRNKLHDNYMIITLNFEIIVNAL